MSVTHLTSPYLVLWAQYRAQGLMEPVDPATDAAFRDKIAADPRFDTTADTASRGGQITPGAFTPKLRMLRG